MLSIGITEKVRYKVPISQIVQAQNYTRTTYHKLRLEQVFNPLRPKQVYKLQYNNKRAVMNLKSKIEGVAITQRN